MKIFVDVDGILTNFNKAAIDFYKVSKDTVFEKGSWDSVPKICEATGLTHKEFWGGLTEEFWSKMEWMPDGKDILMFLCNKVEHVCLLTSPANPTAAKGRMLWIQNELRDMYNNRQFLLGSNKFYVAHSKTLLIDDYDKNVDAFSQYGGLSYLYPRYWNSRHKLSCQKNLLDNPYTDKRAWLDFTAQVSELIKDKS